MRTVSCSNEYVHKWRIRRNNKSSETVRKYASKRGRRTVPIIDFGEKLPIEHALCIDDIIDPNDLEDLHAERVTRRS